MPDNPQPQPGPTPTPSPVPTHSIQIGGIETIANGDGIITPASEWIPAFPVTKDYMQTCDPQVGGYFVEFEDCVTFMSSEDFEERYGF